MGKGKRFFRFPAAIFLSLGLMILLASSVLAADTVKIATLTDMSGPYAELAGWGNINAAKMAIEDFGGKVLGMNIEFIYRDHQSKADMANQKAIELYEKEKVDAVFDCPNSAAGLAVSNQALRYKKLFFPITSGTTRYTGDQCNRYTFHWAYNDYVLATAAGTWAADHLGKRWYTITADYAWGHDLLKHFSNALKKRGGTLLGNEMVALGASDFSPYLLKAMNAKPEVVALLNAGKDTVNSTKQSVEFGVKKSAKIVHALLFPEDIKAAGPEVFADDYVTASWDWKVDNPGAKEFVAKWMKKYGKPPNWLNAANYSCVTQYLQAIKRAGSKDPKAVVKALEGHKFNDFFANPGIVRAEDHMRVGKAYVLRAKKPTEIKEPWDYFEIVGTIPMEQAYMNPKETGCKMGEF